MAGEDTKYYSNAVVRIHIRVLYLVLLVVVTGALCGFWICFSELLELRKDLNAEIGKRTLVEFSGQDSYSVPSRRSYGTFAKSQEPHILFTYKEKSSANQRNGPFYGENEDPLEHEDTEGGEDQLLRVKRDAQKLNSFYKEGSGIPDDYVWLTSYARIPVSFLFNFIYFTFSWESFLQLSEVNNPVWFQCRSLRIKMTSLSWFYDVNCINKIGKCRNAVNIEFKTVV